MNVLRRVGDWLCARLFRRVDPVPIDPEVRELATRVDTLEHVAAEQDERLSVVEVRVNIRRPPSVGRRDAS